MTKTVHPLLSHYSFTKWGEGREGAYSRGGAYCKFRPIGGSLIRRGAYSRGHLFEGGGGGATSKIYGNTTLTLQTKHYFLDSFLDSLLPLKTRMDDSTQLPTKWSASVTDTKYLFYFEKP